MPRFEAVERFFELALLGLVSAGFLAVAGSGFLDAPTMALVAGGICARILLVLGVVRFELPDRLINALTVSYIGFFPLDYFWISQELPQATVHLVCFLAVMKILTARTNRDYVYTAAISLMELVAAAMLSSSLSFFAYLAVYMVCAIAAFTSAEMRRAMAKQGNVAVTASARVGPRLALLTAFLTAGILVLTLGLFVVLPRTANVAYRRWLPPGRHLTGFANEVTLGQVGEIQTDSRPVMHIRPYQDSARMPADLKWRGNALGNFDGKQWTDSSTDGRMLLPATTPLTLADDSQRSRRDGVRLLYRVDLNTSESDALFIGGVPEFLNIDNARVIRTATDSYRLSSIPGEMVRYEVSSFVPNGLPVRSAKLTGRQRERYLQLPAVDARIRELALSWAGSGGELQRALRIQKHLRADFQYTLEMPAVASEDPLAEFLFVRKKGYCEYFASAMTVMLRTMGVPARIVNGFQSGTFNPVSGMYVVRGSDAHSWVEAYEPGLGWVTFDPTPSAPRSSGAGLLAKAGMYFDAAQTFWQDWVVNYDIGRQVILAGKLEERTRGIHWPSWHSPDLKGLSRWESYGRLAGASLAALLALLLFVFMVWRFLPGWRHTRKLRSGNLSAADATVFYSRMLRAVKRRGYQKPAWFTPREFAATLPDSELSLCVAEFTDRYQALRFGGDAAAARDLSGLLDRLERSGGNHKNRVD